MKKNLAKKVMLSILAGAMLMSSSVAWAAEPVWGDNSGTNAIAIGTGAEASGNYSNAVGSGAQAIGDYSNAIGYGAKTVIEGANGVQFIGNYSNAIGYEASADRYSNAIGYRASASSFYTTAIGQEASASANAASAFGSRASASAYQSTAIGRDASASAYGAIALGFGSIASEADVVSVGDGGAKDGEGNPLDGADYRRIINVADGVNDNDAVTVAQLKEKADLTYVNDELAKKANADDVYTMSETNGLLGQKADKADTLAGYGITDAYTKTAADELLGKKADKATTIAGYGITDAYTKTEVDTELGKKADKTELEAEATTRAEKDNELLARIDLVSDGAADAIAGINQRLDKTNAKINKVGAGAAALAALHPLEYDPDDKLTFSAGMGNYAGENAAALGAFYRPNEKFMVSLGGTMGNGENMVNLGLSIGLDKPNGYAKLSKRELIQEVNAVKAENQVMKDQLANADERIAKLEALVAQLVKK